MNLQKARSTLLEALKCSGELIKRKFGRVRRRRYKGTADIVTEVDTASERLIIKIIRGSFPDHAFVCEENTRIPHIPGTRTKGSAAVPTPACRSAGRPRQRGTYQEHQSTCPRYTWLVDPLDGTVNYAHGFPVSCVSIALLDGREPILGGVYDPFRNELFLAVKGQGSTLNGRPTYISKTRRLSRSLLLTGFPYDRMVRPEFYLKFYSAFLKRCHGVRRSGAAALDLAWVACGRVDGFWEFNLHPWDVAAGYLLVKEAGGKVTDFSGKMEMLPLLKIGTGPIFSQTLLSNGRIHSEMLGLIRKALRE